MNRPLQLGATNSNQLHTLILAFARKSTRILNLRTSALTITGLAIGSNCLAAAPDSAFTGAEVAAGRVSYQNYCAGCHGENLEGFTDAPPLSGATFKSDWSKYTVRRLYDFVSKTMPGGLEGDLSAETYSNVIAFILAVNGAKPGLAHLNPHSSAKIGDIANGGPVYAVIRASVDPKTKAGP